MLRSLGNCNILMCNTYLIEKIFYKTLNFFNHLLYKVWFPFPFPYITPTPSFRILEFLENVMAHKFRRPNSC